MGVRRSFARAQPEGCGYTAQKGELEKRFICRTFSDCTTAPRNGLISGGYPLHKRNSTKPEAQTLKQI